MALFQGGEAILVKGLLDSSTRAFLHCNCDHGELIEPAKRTDDRPDASGEAGAPGGSVNVDLSELRSLLSAIAALLALLLAVSTATLVVLVKRPGAVP